MSSSKPAACAPRVWDKFSSSQKRTWRMFYKDFISEWGISEKKLSKGEREVIASNHATLAVWAAIK